MKPILQRILFILLVIPVFTKAQITNPVIKAAFGVEADLRANFYNGFTQSGVDDWFSNGNLGTGVYIIDTTGAPFYRKRYTLDPNFRRVPFFKGMRYPQFSIVNGKMLIDAIFIRDHHGDDSTVFSTGNKNAQSPAVWSTPVSQSIPDKDDILDIFMHVRRDGTALTDSLWLFGGVSIDGTTGNRYFDFEMYQTDIYYNRSTMGFGGYGPDAGHTSWEFDGAGNVTKVGDVIFTAEYGSSSLSFIEARIWVNQSSLAVTPMAFNWAGTFDGATSGSTFGYAGITPKSAGDFYTGLQCGNNTWAGPFGLVLSDNSFVADYKAKQFMEFSVNLSKLGLDRLAATNDPCVLPFRRILVKSRASTSFNAELKDFVGPFSFFRAPMVDASADIPFYCGVPGVSVLSVNNPIATSTYIWSTTNGNIVGDSIGPEITVNQAGTYIVSQELMDSCGTTYARDTVVITIDPNCTVLKTAVLDFSATSTALAVALNWQVTNNNANRYFEVERSYDAILYTSIARIVAKDDYGIVNYAMHDNSFENQTGYLYYRLKLTDDNGNVGYSKTIVIANNKSTEAAMKVLHNPATGGHVNLLVQSPAEQAIQIMMYTQTGTAISFRSSALKSGANYVSVDLPANIPNGLYFIQATIGNKRFTEKIILVH